MNKAYLALALVAVLVVGVSSAVFLITSAPAHQTITTVEKTTSAQKTENLSVKGRVLVQAFHPDGTLFYQEENHNLITTVGKDFIAAQLGSTSPGTNGANYIGLSTNTKVPHVSDTCISTTDGGTTSAEITDANGLARAQATYAHTGGTNTYTETKTFTATGAYTAVQKAGAFTAAANGDTCAGGNDGTMLSENTFTAVTLAANDQLTVTWTYTLS